MKLDIIIPVYRNVEMVRACLESLTRHLDEISAFSPKLIVINDSPDDEEVETYLKDCQAAGRIDIHIRNPENLGFVRSVNKGLVIAKKDGAAALLVNSDTLTYRDTLAEMMAVLQADPQIGFVCPRSNNAALATFPPAPHNLSGIATTPEICHIAWESVYRYLPRYTFSPTAVGFYLLISPQVITNFGYLDEAFGVGYEEENDLVMRASKVGYRAVLANHAFAYHAGSASFKLHEIDYKGQQQDNLRMIDARHPEFLPLVWEFEGSAEYRATSQIANLVPTSDGKLKMALNLLSIGHHHNGTNELIVNFIRWCDRQPHEDFEIHIICKRSVAEFHKLDKLNHVRLRTDVTPGYAIAIFRPALRPRSDQHHGASGADQHLWDAGRHRARLRLSARQQQCPGALVLCGAQRQWHLLHQPVCRGHVPASFRAPTKGRSPHPAAAHAPVRLCAAL
jgi:GT2 family glycosyltransferase